MPIKNLIFDLDGTLIDSSDGVVEAVNYSLRELGEKEQPPARIKAFIGYPLSQMYPQFTDAPFDQLYSHFQKKAAETVVASTEMLPGVQEGLQRLQEQGYRMAIASTKIKRHIDGIMKKFDWQDLFAAYAGGDEVRQVKPAPEILLLVLSRMKAMAPETLVVGDTINDVQAAKAVPMKVIAVASPYGNREHLLDAEPDYFVETFATIFNVLNR